MMDVKVSGKNLVIKLDIDTLVNAFNFKEENQEEYEVKYKRKFAEGLAEYLRDSCDSETGLTAFQELLDGIFDEMVCDDVDYIKSLNEVEE